ncbi:hypothetical protein [Nocardioides humi]
MPDPQVITVSAVVVRDRSGALLAGHVLPALERLSAPAQAHRP